MIEEDPAINEAEVTGTPTLGDDVSSTDTAEVDIVFNDLQITKAASAGIVFVGDTVTYEYAVTNPGENALVPGPGLTRDTLLVDDQCTSVAFVDGDTDDDEILQPGGIETWNYECTIEGLTDSVLNTSPSS